ncbi:hypothetical protein D5085_12775 [Ectothiorhodospiraceae bacterium BW-2]|nr:hypothetical protein D5085_12775 [Ectothiorhodospiraceae bacterium BW-2]
MPLLMLIALYLILSLIVAFLGRKRRMGFWGYFFGSILLTPIIGLLLMLVSAPQTPAH